ncbi:MAG: hypothetical protein ACOC0V_04895, partial [Oceanicaulis sp.]
MERFARLLDSLSLTPQRNAKLALLVEYFKERPDPERGLALAAITGGLKFTGAKSGAIRAIAAERVDPVLFEMSYDYVGDLAETTALIWPRRHGANRTPDLSEVVETLSDTTRAEAPKLIEGWLDALDADGRWALLKLVTGALRVGVSARLAKTALAKFGGKDVTAFRLSAEWTPTADLFFRLAYDNTEDESNPRHGSRVLPGAAPGSAVLDDIYDTNAGLTGENVTNTEGVSLTGEWNINEAWTFKSITAYREG